uniref:ATP-grasp domain-containing protein n=1 Tax=Desertifilum tharense IPPAS B-1220 TaxID=1781255 RepID=A0ACD5GVY9_9CYAN
MSPRASNTTCAATQAYRHAQLLGATPRFDPQGFINALIEIIHQEKIDFLIPTCEEIFYIASGLSSLTPYCQVFVEPLEKLNDLHNKWAFIQKVEALGLPTPKTWFLQTPEDLKEILERPVILKPVYSRFASNVHLLTQPISTIPNLDLHPQKNWVAQEFITGKQYCTYSIAHQGQLTAHAAYPVEYTAKKGSCIYFKSIEHPQLLAWVKTFVQAEQFTGQIAFDFIQAEDGTVYPLECNPRAISAIHLFQSSDKLEQAFLNSKNPLVQPQPQKSSMLAMAMILYGLLPAIAANQFQDWFRKFTTSQDVILQLSDPMPFFLSG